MNKKRLLKLADTIEKAPHVVMDEAAPEVYYTDNNIIGFDMSVYSAHGLCGTVGCIAGYAAMLWPPTKKSDSKFIIGIAAKALGLSEDEAEELFVPYNLQRYRDITPLMAAQVLRLIAAGIPIDDAWEQITAALNEEAVRGVLKSK